MTGKRVAIVGAGLGGLALAALLARLGMSVRVISIPLEDFLYSFVLIGLSLFVYKPLLQPDEMGRP
jgi:2-polyprenyl-6-methoxyphenol hydroxylase-like FAD-dependent oxidoreductase